MNKIGILMVNMGGPRSLLEVESYLSRIFTDNDIMKLPFQKYFGPFLARMKAPKTKKHYAEIGGKSPLYDWSQLQGEKMLTQIKNDKIDMKHYIGFRYAEPLAENAIYQMIKDNIKRIVIFSQYPQYCCSTTGSSLNAIYRYCLQNQNLVNGISWSIIDRWHNHPGLIKAFAENIRSELQKFPEKQRKNVVILFSAHSIPLSAVKRGDPYPHEIAATVDLVMKELNNSHPYRLVWQSKVGPVEWLAPFTDEVIRGLIGKGHTALLLVPIAFTSDHIETLHELDIEYTKELRESILQAQTSAETKSALERDIIIRRAPSLNDNATFIKALADILVNHLKSGETFSTQMRLTCPHCINPTCLKMREYFASHGVT